MTKHEDWIDQICAFDPIFHERLIRELVLQSDIVNSVIRLSSLVFRHHFISGECLQLERK
jgi:hypothetical protein